MHSCGSFQAYAVSHQFLFFLPKLNCSHSSLINLTKTRIEWPPVLIATANFPSLLFQLLQYPRQCLSCSAHRAAPMTKTVFIFPAFPTRFVDFAVQFCFRCKFLFHEKRRASQVWQWRDFLGPIKVLLLRIATVDSMVLSIKILLSLRNVKVLSNKLDMLIYCTLQMHMQQATYPNLLWVTCERATPFLS